jgi:hypothetical protein
MTPSAEQRLAALNHALYEMEMFVDLPTRCGMTEVSNAIAESYLIHARVLCDFFQQERSNDDVICDDYNFKREPLGVPDDIKQRFNKSLAHLTYSRLKFTEDKKQWITDKFRPQLLERIQEFLQHIVANPRLGGADEIERARSLLARLPQMQAGRPTAQPSL